MKELRGTLKTVSWEVLESSTESLALLFTSDEFWVLLKP